MVPETGSSIGPYQIVAPLGAGGMGRVFRARDTRLGRDIALKFLHDAEGPAASARLLREARAASALNHPNVCQVYDVGDSEYGSWIAMEFIPGDPLNTRIPAGGLPAATAIRLGSHIAAALAHAHERGVVHRDLKTGNCVWSADGGIKVLDFGLAGHSVARRAEELTQTVSVQAGPAGTPAYMAPEVLRGQRADERSDLWALGVILYEMASGSRPFSGSSSYDLGSSILNSTPAPLSAESPAVFRTIVARLLEKDPEARYRTALEVTGALEALRESTPALPGASLTPPRRRTRNATIGAALVLAGLVALGVWWSLRDRLLELEDVQLVSTFEGSHGAPSLSPDGKYVAFVSRDSSGVQQIWVKSLAEGAPLQITHGLVPADRPRWHPDGSVIAFARRGQGIWTVAALGGTPVRLAEQGANPNYSRDGKKLTWETNRTIWIAAADGSGAREVPGVPAKYYFIPRMPALSPDGSQIAFFHAEAGPNGDLHTIPAAGGTERRLTFDVREGSAPVWTLDGRRIVYSSARAGSRTLWQIPANGGDPKPLTTGAGEDDTPDFSADGSRLIFTNVRNSWQLRVRDGGGAERQLLERRTEILFPMFSPDGSRIVFFGRSDWAVAIFTIARDGTDFRQLTAGRALNHQPRWSADGNHVFFYQIRPELGLRRVPAMGGPSTQVFPWSWETRNAVQFDPAGQRLVYTRLNPVASSAPEPEATVVHRLADGVEMELPQPHIHYPHFSRDGRFIAGSRHDGMIAICSADGAGCRAVARTGTSFGPVSWSGDGSRLYFLRTQRPDGVNELWSVRVDGTDERKHPDLSRFRQIDRFFDISSGDEVVWAPTTEGRRELWAASIK